MKVGICEVAPELMPDSADWRRLSAIVRETRPALFLLNELPFGPWIASGVVPDEAVFAHSCRLHEAGIAQLGELGSTAVLTTRPTQQRGRRVNEAVLWTSQDGVKGMRTKQYFPNEEGYYEARWFEAGEPRFEVFQAGDARVGMLICTEIMFNEHARRYGRERAQIIAVPRAVGPATLDRWLVAMRMAAITSGCYVITSNRGGSDARGQRFGGSGWVIDPDGNVVARTAADTPVVVVDLDLDWPARAQRQYPCYVPELS